MHQLKQTGLAWAWLLAAAAVFAGGLFFGLQYFTPRAQEPLSVGGIYFDQPQPVEDFRLAGIDDAEFTADDLRGDWTFIYFGYTFCPDACPLTLAQLSKVQQQLAQQNLDNDVGYLLISVDPARDSPERLKEYTASFHPKFRGTTGEREQLDTLTSALGIYYQIHDPEPGEDYYLVDHSSALVLINPQGRLQAVLTPPFSPAQLTEDFLAIRERYRPAAG